MSRQESKRRRILDVRPPEYPSDLSGETEDAFIEGEGGGSRSMEVVVLRKTRTHLQQLHLRLSLDQCTNNGSKRAQSYGQKRVLYIVDKR